MNAAYYNEIDPFAAQWLRNLIAAGHIAHGDVDTRSITEVQPDDLRGYTQCHFFAGIGGWSYALRLAGWPDDRPVWTGSCPCQPFSAAGKQRGSDDERHLWPAFFRLIRQCRPAIVFGEQVAGAAGYAWWDHVAADVEGEGYAAAAADIGAHSVGAPHLRQRLYWVANSAEIRRGQERSDCRGIGAQDGAQGRAAGLDASGQLGAVAHAKRGAAERRGLDLAAAPTGVEGQAQERQWVWNESRTGFDAGRVADADQQRHYWSGPCGAGRDQSLDSGGMDNTSREGPQGHGADKAASGRHGAAGPTASAGAINSWADLEWLQCSDGKARPTQSGLFPLAHGVSARVGRLRAYGNAIVPQVAARFVMACMP